MSNFTGEKIAQLRIQRGMSQAQLGEAVGLKKSAIGMYERGERYPSRDIIEKLADYFNVSVSQLVDKATFGEKIKSVTVDGLSDAEIGFIAQFHLYPENVRQFALTSVEALLKATLLSADTQAEENEKP